MKTRFYRIFKFSRIFKPSLLNFVLRRIDRVKSLWATKSVSLIVLKIQTRFMVVFFSLAYPETIRLTSFLFFPVERRDVFSRIDQPLELGMGYRVF